MFSSLQTVVETPEFIKRAEILMDETSRNEFVEFIAKNPLEGDLITGIGGIRKIRWERHANQGKRGGVRIIYYYHSKDIPIFLFTVYAKNQKDNLTMQEKNMLRKIVGSLIKSSEKLI